MVFKFKKKKKEENSDKLSKLTHKDEGKNNEPGEKKEKSNSWYRKVIDNAITSKNKSNDIEEEECEENVRKTTERDKDYELEEQLKETLRSITSLSTKIVNYETKIQDLEKELKIEKDKQVDKLYEQELREKEDFIKQKIGMLNEKENLLNEKELDINMREEKMNDRETFIAKKEDKLNDMQVEYVEKNKEKEKLHFEITDIKISLEKLKYEVKDKKECLENVSNKVISKENTLRELKEFIKEKNELIEHLDEKINEKEKIYEQLGKDVEEKRKIIELLDSKANEKEKHFEEKIKELEKEQGELLEKLNEIKIREKNVETRENDFLHMENELKDLTNNVSKNDCQLKIYELEIKDLSNALVEKEMEILDLKNTYNDEINLLKGQIKEKEKEIANCSSKSGCNCGDIPGEISTEMEHTEQQDINEGYKQKLEDLLKVKEKEINELETKYEKEIDTLNKELNDKKKECIELKNSHIIEINNLNDELEESESKMIQLKNNHEMEIYKLHNEINALSEEKHMLSNEKQVLSGEINKLNEEKHTLATEKDELNSKIKILNSEINTLNSEKDTLSGEIRTLNDMIHNLKHEISTSDNEINKLKDMINTLNDEKEGQEKFLIEIENNYKNEIKILKEKLKDTDNQMNINIREELDHLKNALNGKEKENKQMKEDYDKKIKEYDEELQSKERYFEEELNNIHVKSHEKEQILILKNDELKELKLKTEEKYLKLYDDRMNLFRNICSKICLPYCEGIQSEEIVEMLGDYINKMSKQMNTLERESITNIDKAVSNTNEKEVSENVGNENPKELDEGMENTNNTSEAKDEMAGKKEEKVIHELKKELECLQEQHREEMAKMECHLSLKEKEIEESKNQVSELINRINNLNETISLYKENNSEEKINAYISQINTLSLTLSELKVKNDQEQLEKQNEITKLTEELSYYKKCADVRGMMQLDSEEAYKIDQQPEKKGVSQQSEGKCDSEKEHISESDMEGGGNLKSFLNFPLRKIKGKKQKSSKNEKEIQTDLKRNELDKDENEKMKIHKKESKEMEKYKNELKDKMKIIEDLKNKICSLTNEVMDLKNMKNELAEKDNKLTKVVEETERQKREKDIVSTNLRKANEEIERLSEEVLKMKKEEMKSREEITKWEEEAANWKKELEDLKNSSDKMNAEFYTKENNYMLKLNENLGVIQNFKDLINENEKEKEKYISDINNLKNEFEVLKLKHDELTKEYDSLNGMYKSEKSKNHLTPDDEVISKDENKSSEQNENYEKDKRNCDDNMNTCKSSRRLNEQDAGNTLNDQSEGSNCVYFIPNSETETKRDESALVVNDYINEIAHLKEEINRLSLLYSNELNRKNSCDIKSVDLMNEVKELEMKDKENKKRILSLTKINEKMKIQNEKLKSRKFLSKKEESAHLDENLESKSGGAENLGNDRIMDDQMDDVVGERTEEMMHLLDVREKVKELEGNNFRLMKILHERNSTQGEKIIGSYLYSKNVEDLYAIGNVNNTDVESAQENTITVVCIIVNEILSILFLNDKFVNTFEKINRNLWKLMYIPEEIRVLIFKYFYFLDKLRNYVKSLNEKLSNERYDDSWFLFQNYLETASNIKREMMYFILEEKNREEIVEKDGECEDVDYNNSNSTKRGKIIDILNFSKDEMRLKTIAQLRKDLNFEKKSKNMLNRDYHLLLYKYQECMRKLRRVRNMIKELNLNDSTNRADFALNRELDKYSEMSNENYFSVEKDEVLYTNYKDCILHDDNKNTILESQENVLTNSIINLRKIQNVKKNNNNPQILLSKNNLINSNLHITSRKCGEDAFTHKGEMHSRPKTMDKNRLTNKYNRLGNTPKINYLDDMKKVKNIFNEFVGEKRDIIFVHKSPFC
ncbi:hypothetical protein, conserved [Plasmodium gonderi]|uniref:Repetitive organellar protein n=1 Tax=Plasmodium gonderi TaxID=77519 RepID=A0A1Y1JAP1_PLAGO|nr:hypothetical protein, conserved [Plasmodium gonderi]GAW79579.1 hypothetical protein, conserved [Plasmodium gonderi]